MNRHELRLCNSVKKDGKMVCRFCKTPLKQTSPGVFMGCDCFDKYYAVRVFDKDGNEQVLVKDKLPHKIIKEGGYSYVTD